MVNVPLQRPDGSDIVLDNELNEYSGILPIQVDTTDTQTHKLYLLDTFRFVKDGMYSLDFLDNLYREYARVYISTSQGEEVFYVAPGINIINFLQKHYTSVEFSLDGQLRLLGEDWADFSALRETRDVDQKIWIQHPTRIRDEDHFAAQEEYLFIHTSRGDILRHQFGHRIGSEKSEDFSKEHSLSLERDSVYIAKIHVKKQHRFLEEVDGTVQFNVHFHTRERCREVGNRGNAAICFGGGDWSAIEEHRSKRTIVKDRESFVSFSEEDIPVLMSGRFDDGYNVQDADKGFFMAELVPLGRQENNVVSLKSTKKDEHNNSKGRLCLPQSQSYSRK